MGEFSYYFHNVINGEKYWCFERLKALMQSTTLIFNKKHISSTLELFNRNENEDVMKLCSKNISEKTFSKRFFQLFRGSGPGIAESFRQCSAICCYLSSVDENET